MKLLIDAQLPARLALSLQVAGHDVVHSSELPDGNRTSDLALAKLADADGRVMVTKDRDFEISHLLRAEPHRLLLVTTGNIANKGLRSPVIGTRVAPRRRHLCTSSVHRTMSI